MAEWWLGGFVPPFTMTSFLRKTLAKKMAPFFKGITADNLQLSLLRGKGGLKDMGRSRASLRPSNASLCHPACGNWAPSQSLSETTLAAELKEDAIMEAAQFPPWLVLERAVCNSIKFKISWTKLKSVPIRVVRCTPNPSVVPKPPSVIVSISTAVTTQPALRICWGLDLPPQRC